MNIQNSPQIQKAILALCFFLLNSQGPLEASTLKKQGTSQSWEKEREQSNLAVQCRGEKDFPKALAACTELVRLSRGTNREANTYRYRGETYLMADNFEAAMKDFDSAVRLEPSETNYVARAQAYKKVGRFRDAQKDYSKALRYCADDDDRNFVLSARSEVYERLGEIEKSVTDAYFVCRYYYFTRRIQESPESDRIRRFTGAAPVITPLKNDRGAFVLARVKQFDLSPPQAVDAHFMRVFAGQKFRRLFPTKDLVSANSLSFWHISTRSEGLIDIDLEEDQCTVSADDVKKLFGECTLIPSKTSMKGTHGPPWLVIGRPWGRMSFMLGEKFDGVENAVTRIMIRLNQRA